jgi:hypothetical protein
VADGGRRCPQAIRRDNCRSTTRRAGAPTRELAQRLTGGVEVLLLWYPDIDLVELSLQDRATGGGLRVEVAPEDAIDAFYHPYAYASACDVHRDDEYDGTINDA